MAVAQAASGLHHELALGDVADGVLGFAAVFFAIWWAWVNCTWFASAFDDDDVPYHLATLVEIGDVAVPAAVVLVAATVPFGSHPLAVGLVLAALVTASVALPVARRAGAER